MFLIQFFQHNTYFCLFSPNFCRKHTAIASSTNMLPCAHTAPHTPPMQRNSDTPTPPYPSTSHPSVTQPLSPTLRIIPLPPALLHTATLPSCPIIIFDPQPPTPLPPPPSPPPSHHHHHHPPLPSPLIHPPTCTTSKACPLFFFLWPLSGRRRGG